MPHDLPPGFKSVSGERGPKDGGSEWFICLRMGFCDLQRSYRAEQLIWKHGGHSGDIVAVKPA